MLSLTLRKLIEQKLTTAREIGELTGTAPSTVYRWIRGEANPSFDTIRLLMRHVRSRAAQSALLTLFTASTPWSFYAADSIAPAAEGTGPVNVCDAVDAALDAVRDAGRALAEVSDSTPGRPLKDAEVQSLIQRLNKVVRSCSATQQILTRLIEQRQNTRGVVPPAPHRQTG